MAEDTAKHQRKLASLISTLNELEKELAPLLSQALPETTLNLDSIQQAKLNILIPYLVYDLAFSQLCIYTKT
jgi:exosome complex protein LRP1